MLPYLDALAASVERLRTELYGDVATDGPFPIIASENTPTEEHL
jgi:hypothetical protein